MQLLNLTNVQDLEEPAFADLDVRGYIMGNAPIVLTGRSIRTKWCRRSTSTSRSKARSSST